MPALQKEFGYANPMQVPRLTKIVVNIGLGEALTNAKALDAAVGRPGPITGQKPIVTRPGARSPSSGCGPATRSGPRSRCAASACGTSWSG